LAVPGRKINGRPAPETVLPVSLSVIFRLIGIQPVFAHRQPKTGVNAMYPIPSKTSLHFPWAEVLKALAELRQASSVRPLYGNETGPGLWLVGDEGVYLMPNTTLKARTIVYARECNPTALDFDTWWANKRVTFGGDDGVEFIALTHIDRIAAELETLIKAPQYLFINISPDQFTIGIR
jgi:hypothetical protein